MSSDNKYVEGIKKTGFILEHSISEYLEAHGWIVINNRYYIDDVNDYVREIDIVAYKATNVGDFHVYTTLVISCKKNERNIWALLSRKKNLQNPNFIWNPVYYWTNNKAVNYSLETIDWKAKYFLDAKEFGISSALSEPELDIFAYQEMSKTNASISSAQNDKSIYQAITSLLKAQAYEIDSLNSRTVIPQVRQFNLLSIVDTEIIRLMFEGDSISVANIDQDAYLARYIINKQHTPAIINIMTASHFYSQIKQYNLLHDYNCKYFGDLSSEFYLDAIENYKKRTLFIDEFRNNIYRTIWPLLYRNGITPKKEGINIYLLESKVIIDLEEEFDYDLLNNNADIIQKSSEILSDIYRYDGPFVYKYIGIPF